MFMCENGIRFRMKMPHPVYEDDIRLGFKGGGGIDMDDRYAEWKFPGMRAESSSKGLWESMR